MSATIAKRVRGAERAAVTANRLRDGAVLWRTAGDGWTIHFAQAAVFDAADLPDALAAAKRDEPACLVVGVYATPVTAAGPASWKERIRAEGPTVAVSGGLHGQD